LTNLFFLHCGIQCNEQVLLLTFRYRATAGDSHGINSSLHQKKQPGHPLLFQFFFYDSAGSDDSFHCPYGGIARSYSLAVAGDLCGETKPFRALL
jgi:hypothetical protein